MSQSLKFSLTGYAYGVVRSLDNVNKTGTEIKHQDGNIILRPVAENTS
jgi:hypothetical protein